MPGRVSYSSEHRRIHRPCGLRSAPRTIEMQYSDGPVTIGQFSIFEPRRKYALNSTELARDKFNALFADHDAKDTREAANQQKSASKTVKKLAKKNVKPQ